MSSNYSYGKVMEYVAAIATHDIEVMDEKGNIVKYVAPSKIVISPLFYRNDGCNRCGKCCRNYDICFTKTGYDIVMGSPYAKYTDMKEAHILINGREKTIYYDPPTSDNRSKVQCKHLKFNTEGMSYCNIHSVRSVTCKIPHMTLRHNKQGTTSISRQQYGRNWALGCTFEFSETFDYDTFLNSINELNDINVIAKDLGIETHYNLIVRYLNSIKKNLQNNIVPTKQKQVFPIIEEVKSSQSKLF